MTDFEFDYEDPLGESSKPPSPVWRILYLGFILFIIVVLFINATGLSHWLVIGRLRMQDLTGETEDEVIGRLGEPDYRSTVQPFRPGEGIGPVPQRLDRGDEFYSLNFIIGPRLYVFHFVAPETFTKHTGRLVLGDEWVVLEYYNTGRYVLY